MMDGIRKILRLQAESAVLRNRHPAGADQTLGASVESPQLDTRLGRMALHRPPVAALKHTRRQTQSLA